MADLKICNLAFLGIMFRMRDMTPTCQDALLQTLLTWLMKVSLSSIITPSSFISEFCSLVESIIAISNSLGLFFGPNLIT